MGHREQLLIAARRWPLKETRVSPAPPPGTWSRASGTNLASEWAAAKYKEALSRAVFDAFTDYTMLTDLRDNDDAEPGREHLRLSGS